MLGHPSRFRHTSPHTPSILLSHPDTPSSAYSPEPKATSEAMGDWMDLGQGLKSSLFSSSHLFLSFSSSPSLPSSSYTFYSTPLFFLLFSFYFLLLFSLLPPFLFIHFLLPLFLLLFFCCNTMFLN